MSGRASTSGKPGALAVFPDEGPDDGARRYIESFDRLTFSVPANANYPTRSFCLVALHDSSADSPDAKLEYLAVQRKGGKITSFERRMVLEHFEPFDPVPLVDLVAALPVRLQSHFGEGRIPPATWAAALAALIRMRPSVSDSIERLAGTRARWLARSRAAASVALERDAVGLALDLADIGRGELSPWTPGRQPAPFLQSLDSALVREDTAIRHDAAVFGDWKTIRRHQVGAVEFANRRGDRLTIINVNRQPIERTLGVDLLYYTHAFDAFVLVQYKSLRRENGGFVYRPNLDNSLDRELQRMRQIVTRRRGHNIRSFRLDPQPFYLKFCRNVILDPLSRGMVKGMYLPLPYWDALVAAGAFAGPRGGHVVTDATVERYLRNSEFVALVQDGWIGSSDITSQEIASLVRAGLASSDSLVLATHYPPDDIARDE